jgi:TolB protein
MTKGTLAAAILVIVDVPTPSRPPPAFVTVRQEDRRASSSEVPAASVTTDGRYVAFTSYARLLPSDTNDNSDIYVLDRLTQTVTIESLTIEGSASNRDSLGPRISDDGRLLVYETTFDHAGPGPFSVIVLRDRRNATTQLIRRGDQNPNGPSRAPAISRDGRVVVFASSATNLNDGPDVNGSAEDIYAYDTASRTVSLVSVDSTGRQPTRGSSFAPTISADGRFIAFTSMADLDGSRQSTPPGLKPLANVYLRDTRLGTTTRVSTRSGGGLPNGSSYDAAISGDGRRIAFTSDATNLGPRDDNGVTDIFLVELDTKVVTLVSRSVSGKSANGPSGRAAISTNGDTVVFQSDASDLTCVARCPEGIKDINLVSDVFAFDRSTRTIRCLSTGRQRWMEPSAAPAVDGTGTVSVFSSRHPIDAQDVGNDFDLFIRVEPEEFVLRRDATTRS